MKINTANTKKGQARLPELAGGSLNKAGHSSAAGPIVSEK